MKRYAITLKGAEHFPLIVNNQNIHWGDIVIEGVISTVTSEGAAYMALVATHDIDSLDVIVWAESEAPNVMALIAASPEPPVVAQYIRAESTIGCIETLASAFAYIFANANADAAIAVDVTAPVTANYANGDVTFGIQAHGGELVSSIDVTGETAAALVATAQAVYNASTASGSSTAALSANFDGAVVTLYCSNATQTLGLQTTVSDIVLVRIRLVSDFFGTTVSSQFGTDVYDLFYIEV